MTVSTDLNNAFASLFPLFRRHPELSVQLLEKARRIEVPGGTSLYWEGDSCAGIAFLVAGEIRVFKCGESGREITLYEIGPGETCILNVSCILGNNVYPANAETTTASTLIMVPAPEFKRLLDSDDTMRTFVFSLLSQRLAEVMALVHEVAFGRLNQRLVDYLVEKSADGVLATTHQKIANDLGTSREVVSRLLKEFERQGLLLLARNEIRLSEGFASGFLG